MSIPISLPSWEIATPLETAHCLPSEMSSSDARQLLGSLSFDQAPVMREGRVTGWVRTAHLVSRGIVGARTTELDRCTILARDTPVSDTIKAVAREHLVFLAGPSGISEFVVPSDLDRHAVRCYLYVLVSELEMRMGDLVDAALTTEDLMCALKGERRRYQQAVDNGVETRVIDYLDFSAYKSLAPRVPEIVRAFPGSPDQLTEQLEQLRVLRNHVAHPTKPMALVFGPTELARLTQLGEDFVGAIRHYAHEASAVVH